MTRDSEARRDLGRWSTFLGDVRCRSLYLHEEDAIEQSHTNPPAGLQRHGVGANRADRKALQGPDPLGRVRPVVIGIIAVSERQGSSKDSAASMSMFASMARCCRRSSWLHTGSPDRPLAMMAIPGIRS